MERDDSHLLSRLLDEHGPSLVLYAQQWCNHPEDVVQEAFLQFVRQESRPDRVVPWLYRVVRNQAISNARAAGRRTRHERAASSERQYWFEANSADAVDAEAVAQALDSLAIDEREAVVLRVWSGLSFEEIADLIGKSTSTAHRRYLAGLDALRKFWSTACLKEVNRKT